MSFLQFIRPMTENVMSVVTQQMNISQQLLDTIKGYVPQVQASWIGDDANAFAEDVKNRLVPAMMELIAAIAGVNLNLTKATNVMDQADAKARGLANQIGDVFGAI